MAICDPYLLLLSTLTEQRTSVTAGEPRETRWSLSNSSSCGLQSGCTYSVALRLVSYLPLFFELIIISVFISFVSLYLLRFLLICVLLYSFCPYLLIFFPLIVFLVSYYVFSVLVCCSLFLFCFVLLHLYTLITPLLSFLSFLEAFAKLRKATISLIMCNYVLNANLMHKVLFIRTMLLWNVTSYE